MKFDGDYEKVVGNKKEKFLQECTKQAPEGVICSDVRKGSIIVDYEGPADDVEKDISAVQTAGALKLASFEVGATVEEVEPDLTDIENTDIVVGDGSEDDEEHTGSGEKTDEPAPDPEP